LLENCRHNNVLADLRVVGEIKHSFVDLACLPRVRLLRLQKELAYYLFGLQNLNHLLQSFGVLLYPLALDNRVHQMKSNVEHFNDLVSARQAYSYQTRLNNFTQGALIQILIVGWALLEVLFCVLLDITHRLFLGLPVL
jgi:hypothetical protein